VDPELESKTKEITLRIFIPKADVVATYAGEDASVAENRIDTIFIDLKQNGVSIHTEKIFGNDLKIEPGSKDSIVNVGFEVSNITIGSLTVEVCANRNYIQPITTEIPLPNPSDPATLFMMTGSTGLTHDGTVYRGTVHLVRHVAKLRIRISKHPVCLPSDLVIDYNQIKIQLLKVPNQCTLTGPAQATGQLGFQYIDYPERTASRKAPHFSPANGGQIDSLYLNENYLTNEADYNSTNTTLVKITLPTRSMTEGAKTDTYDYAIFTNNSYRILRNFIYTLDIQVRGQSLEPVITASLLPWNDAEVEGSITGTYLTTETPMIEFDDQGRSTVHFCTDAQALYVDWAEMKNHLNKSLFPEDIKIISDEKGQILLDQQHCGHFGLRLDLSKKEAKYVSGNIYLKAGNIVRRLTVVSKRIYDAHYITGDSLMSSGDTYTLATVENGGTWLQLSKRKLYNPSEMLSAYTDGIAIPLFLHLDENLTGTVRTGAVVMTRSDGTEQRLKITQLPALYVGAFGTASTAFSDVIYKMGLYTEQIPEEILLQYKTSNDQNALSSSFYSGLLNVQPAWDESGYMDRYASVAYPAINYCAYKNRDKNGNSTLDMNEIEWYLPAQAQLMGMWVAFNGYGQAPTSAFPLNIYWSASNNQGYASEAQYVNFHYGNVGHYYRTQKYSVRCVRNQGTVDNTLITNEGIAPGNYPVIDFSKGMPAGSYSTDNKDAVSGHEASSINQTVYTKLRIAQKDMQGANGQTRWNQTDAMENCRTFYREDVNDTDLGKWRLPTQREMQALWIYQVAIKSKCSTFEYLSEEYYWTATESASSQYNAWTVYGVRNTVGGGNTPNRLKTDALSVRCVMQLP
jgi:hypothetical protein